MSAASRDYAAAEAAALSEAAAAAMAVLDEADCARVDPGIVLEAENLLDLYGEDVRARAFVFDGPDGELCLRPDLTLALCRLHLASGADEAAYAAAGPVFRRPSPGEGRAAQFMQVGCEKFGGGDPAKDEAAMFDLAHRAADAAGATGVEAVTGDLNILFAMIDACPLPERGKARLKRHVWRPNRFHRLLREAAGGDEGGDPGRDALLRALGGLEPDEARAAVERLLTLSETTHVGRRGQDEVAARMLEQAADASADPLPAELVEAVEAAASLEASAADALDRLRDLAHGAGLFIGGALDRFEARLAALSALGHDVEALAFDGEFGRNLEYYDGFVFELFDGARAKAAGRRAAQVAGGGRYDGMLRAAAVAFGRPAPAAPSAVGFALRPEAIVAGGAA